MQHQPVFRSCARRLSTLLHSLINSILPSCPLGQNYCGVVKCLLVEESFILPFNRSLTRVPEQEVPGMHYSCIWLDFLALQKATDMSEIDLLISSPSHGLHKQWQQATPTHTCISIYHIGVTTSNAKITPTFSLAFQSS